MAARGATHQSLRKRGRLVESGSDSLPLSRGSRRVPGPGPTLPARTFRASHERHPRRLPPRGRMRRRPGAGGPAALPGQGLACSSHKLEAHADWESIGLGGRAPWGVPAARSRELLAELAPHSHTLERSFGADLVCPPRHRRDRGTQIVELLALDAGAMPDRQPVAGHVANAIRRWPPDREPRRDRTPPSPPTE
jgi:hypothetical protein